MTTDYGEPLSWNACDRMFVLMLLHQNDSCFPPPPSVMSVLPAAASSPTERGEFSPPPQAPEEAIADAIVHTTALMRSFEHPRRTVVFGGGWANPYQRAYLRRCVYSKGKGNVYIVSHMQEKHQGERWRRWRRPGRRGCSFRETEPSTFSVLKHWTFSSSQKYLPET